MFCLYQVTSHKKTGYFEEFLLNPSDKSIDNYTEMVARYSNRAAYRVGARLSLIESSPMYKLIQYYGEKEGSPIDAEKWV